MAHQIPCPKCESPHLVRVEHVINGGHSRDNLYCGRCDYSWTVEEAAPRQDVSGYRKSRTRPFGPKVP